MTERGKVFEDAARVAGGALGILAGLRKELETVVQQQFRRLLSNMDLVSREEFEIVREMAQKARVENENLQQRITLLEGSKTKRTTPRRKKPPSGKRAKVKI